jgi:hypothetical protein
VRAWKVKPVSANIYVSANINNKIYNCKGVLQD